MLLWTVYAPIAQMTTITGAMIANGMRRIAAHHGTVVSTMIRPAMLPRYMLAISPQTKSGFSTNSSGPGCRPQISRPPSSTAAVGEPGNAERQHRQQRARAGGVRRGLRRDDAFDLALAELRRRSSTCACAMP